MKAVPLNIIDKLKTFFYSFSPSGEFVQLHDKKPAPSPNDPPITELARAKKEKAGRVML